MNQFLTEKIKEIQIVKVHQYNHQGRFVVEVLLELVN